EITFHRQLPRRCVRAVDAVLPFPARVVRETETGDGTPARLVPAVRVKQRRSVEVEGVVVERQITGLVPDEHGPAVSAESRRDAIEQVVGDANRVRLFAGVRRVVAGNAEPGGRVPDDVVRELD